MFDKLRKAARNNAIKQINSYENEKLGNKILENHRKRDRTLKVIRDPEFKNSAYIGVNKDQVRAIKRWLYRARRSQGASKKDAAKETQEFIKDMSRGAGLGKASASRMGTHTVVMGTGSKNPAVLAHELGHATGMTTKLGKKYRNVIVVPGSIAVNSANGVDRGGYNPRLYRGTHAVISANAAHSGFKVAQAKAKGKKVGKWTKHKSWILPALIDAPNLAEEARASTLGLYKMRKAGATRKDMKAGAKGLGSAYLTYAIDPALRLANAGVSYYAGKKLGERYYKNR